jgi:hypothetical protein
MATDQHSHGNRRPHFHRGRRGNDRRGDRERRPQPPGPAPDPSRADGIDVDQIVREIKARIAQRHGIDLSASQIQELAARRLEAILDPRGIKPSLLEQLRKSAGTPAQIAPLEPPAGYDFEDHTIYDTHNGLLRAIRKLLNPLLKLFFNPNPIAHALNTQAKLNTEAAKREQERERTQAEWNALHYTLVERLVTELARTSIEAQSLAMKVESLAARVDLYERRVRGLENTAQPAPAVPAPSFGPVSSVPSARPSGGSDAGPTEASGDGSRRRRRRRRGRRGPGAPDGTGPAIAGAAVTNEMPGDDEGDDGQPGEFEGPAGDGGMEPSPTFTAAPDAPPDVPPPATAPQAISEPQAPAEPAAMPIANGGPTGTSEGS